MHARSREHQETEQRHTVPQTQKHTQERRRETATQGDRQSRTDKETHSDADAHTEARRHRCTHLRVETQMLVDGDGDGKDSDLQDIGAPYVKGHDPKITLSRDKSFFRSASVTNSPPTPLKIPNMILGGAVGGVISILFCK